MGLLDACRVCSLMIYIHWSLCSNKIHRATSSRWAVSELKIGYGRHKLILLILIVALLTEDFCGVEPVTHPPIERETRPPPLVDEEKLRKAYNEFNSVLLACKLSLILKSKAKFLMVRLYLQSCWWFFSYCCAWCSSWLVAICIDTKETIWRMRIMVPMEPMTPMMQSCIQLRVIRSESVQRFSSKPAIKCSESEEEPQIQIVENQSP